MKKNVLSYGCCIIVALLALFIVVAKPFSPNLSVTGQYVIGSLLVAIGIWIFKPFQLPFSMGAAFLAVCLLIIGLNPTTVFSGFTQPALWTLIPALFFGYVLLVTGLGKRIAMGIIKVFKPSYPSMILAWVLIGIALSILTPAITVRVAIVVPIAVYCCQLFQLEKGSKGSSLILLTAFAMALIPGSGWLSGSLWGPIIQGFFSNVPGLEGLITFDSWWRVALLPMSIVTVILVIGGYFALRPTEKISEEAIAELKNTKPTPMNGKEKASAIILVAVFACFVTSSIHNISNAAICLIALIAFFATGILNVKDFSAGISWDLIVFIGMALGLGAVCTETGISQWLSDIVIPALAPIGSNPWLFVFVIIIFMFLWRFIDVAILIPTMAILTPILPGISAAYGVSPLVWAVFYVMSGNAFFLAYQSMWALMSQSIAQDQAWKPRHLATYGTVYFIACLIALAITIPFWISGGLL